MESAPASGSVRPGDQLELSVTGLNHRGDGVARLPTGQVCFVPSALPGETVRVRLVHAARRHWLADLVTVVQATGERCRPPCILAERCGGCSLQHWQPGAQASWKQQLVANALERIGQLAHEVRPILAAPAPLGYRNRAVIPLQRDEAGRFRAGYYRRGSHRIVNMNRCPVLDPRIDALIAPLKADLEASNWPVDVNLSGGGGLRHLALRVGHHSGELLITLVSSHDRLPGLAELAARWQKRWPQLVGVGLNLQPRASNVVLGPETRCIAGRSWLLERFGGIDLRIGADTFFQVNTPQAERLLPLLQSFFQPGPEVPLLDAYCGIGTFSLPLAAAGSPVLGLELHASSVAQARANAERNGLEQVRFEEGDVAAVLAERLEGMAGLLVDPPRKGLTADTLSAILIGRPPRLAYVSCNPATLARDLAVLCSPEGGYRLQRVQPLDFFPQTSHVEAVALLERV